MTPRYSPAELACALGFFEPTDEQAAVIAAPPGPLVVIAGAGAGKTETMAARVVWLVANGYARPGEVLGLTFTRKAAGQLLRRVRTRLARLAGAGLVPGGSDIADTADDSVTVSTYHAFAGNLLREHGLLSPASGSAPACVQSAPCLSNPTPDCWVRHSCGSWRSASYASTRSASTPTRPRRR